MRNASKSSIKKTANNAENRVSRYLWGELRDWKERHDKQGIDYQGNLWTCEVKNWQWPRGTRRTWKILEDAIEQADRYDTSLNHQFSFSVLIPPGTKVEDAFVMYRDCGVETITTLELFRRTVLCIEPKETEDEA